MARLLVLTITESSEELQRRLQHETDARQQERLQMLYWLKQGLVHSRPQIAQLLHCNESTITRWLNAYRQRGLQQLLAVKTPPGAARIILRRRFGELPAGLEERIRQLPAHQIEALAEALLDFTALEEVFAWLERSS
ncbi:DUF4351 domain-containing protein [Thermosynechococcus sp. GLH187]|uniref:DUF4351 domain-containing protein n=1 Tax=unclassified Thermosynechococcus TaxID=2622553 RepID=UPI00197E846E|nr:MULTISPECIES: DUF4351 domain-containing protein [unclassified Thermosynechococcus]QSF48233.1 DUF4351 domain-containing protein [Thermosynechococcus sp. TA-1]WNC28937.1 DUF4351 domain-containing protein [Thermosynechococcus sp. PKX82]WNC44113.1 DUF4351 domain-containing protein [Thermosynechococcus sp. GLH187]WNC46649.1 DUF4351 domain-containing protein [Thermosynechococcus sp. GLH333]WNC49186.1 DUF4351 domain-containing protein [Thermosynechococcus sp. GLH87]